MLTVNAGKPAAGPQDAGQGGTTASLAGVGIAPTAAAFTIHVGGRLGRDTGVLEKVRTLGGRLDGTVPAHDVRT